MWQPSIGLHIHMVPVVRHKRPAPASFCVSPMNAREAGLILGVKARINGDGG
jgi:hypothetical protein